MIAPIPDKEPWLKVISVTTIVGDTEKTRLFTTFDKASVFYDEKMKEWKKKGVKMKRNSDFDHAHASPDEKHLIYLFTDEPVY